MIPWRSDRGPSEAAPPWSEQRRVVPEQANEWKELCKQHPEAALCLAGDFNMTIVNRALRQPAKKALEAGLAVAGLSCVTRSDVSSGKLAESRLDHICLSEAWARRTRVVAAWPGTADGVRLSDHGAVIAEVAE